MILLGGLVALFGVVAFEKILLVLLTLTYAESLYNVKLQILSQLYKTLIHL